MGLTEERQVGRLAVTVGNKEVEMVVRENSYGHSMPGLSLPSCEVCGKPITHAARMSQDKREDVVCGAFDCKMIMAQKASMPPALFENHLKFQKKVHEQNRTREASRQKRLAEISEKEEKEHRQILRHANNHYQESSGKPLQLVVIPSGLSQLSLTPVERIERYAEHLVDIIVQAADCADFDESVYDQHWDAQDKLAFVDERFRRHPELHAMSDRLCTLCKGGCCYAGKEHAYLSVTTIKRYMDSHQEIPGAQILDLYLSHLNEETITNSCINQTATGCALPRELRSDICNAFFCDPLKSYQRKALDNKDTEPVLAIQRAGTYQSCPDPDVFNDVVNITLLDESHTQKVTIP